MSAVEADLRDPLGLGGVKDVLDVKLENGRLSVNYQHGGERPLAPATHSSVDLSSTKHNPLILHDRAQAAALSPAPDPIRQP